MSESNVRFVRKNGRIIPIRSSQSGSSGKARSGISSGDIAKKALYTTGGVLAGAIVGKSIGISFAAGSKGLAKFRAVSKSDTVDASAFMKRRYKAGDLDHVSDTTNPGRRKLHDLLSRATQGDPYFYVNKKYVSWNDPKSFVVTNKKANKYNIAHEIGHHIDLKKNKRNMRYANSILGTLTGAQHRMEKSAWKYAPLSGKERATENFKTLRREGLKTYAIAKHSSRVGAATGGYLAYPNDSKKSR